MLPARALSHRRTLFHSFSAAVAVPAMKWNVLSPTVREFKSREANRSSLTISTMPCEITGATKCRRRATEQQASNRTCQNSSPPSAARFVQIGVRSSNSARWANRSRESHRQQKTIGGVLLSEVALQTAACRMALRASCGAREVARLGVSCLHISRRSR